MRITRLWLSVSRTLGTENKYEPIKLEAGAEVALDRDDDPKAARDALLVEIRQGLRAAYQQHHPTYLKHHPTEAAAAVAAVPEEKPNA